MNTKKAAKPDQMKIAAALARDGVLPHSNPSPQKNVGIFLFPDVEPLDFAGPYEVFAASRTVAESEERLCRVFTITERRSTVVCRYGLAVRPDHDLESHPPLNVLVLPGGRGTPAAMNRDRVLDWILRQHATAELTLSVCTGAFLLAQAGLLDGKPATTHWASLERLSRNFPRIEMCPQARWVEVGKIVTSAGVSAGIDASLHVIRRLFGAAAAAATARGIEYGHWP